MTHQTPRTPTTPTTQTHTQDNTQSYRLNEPLGVRLGRIQTEHATRVVADHLEAAQHLPGGKVLGARATNTDTSDIKEMRISMEENEGEPERENTIFDAEVQRVEIEQATICTPLVYTFLPTVAQHSFKFLNVEKCKLSRFCPDST